MLVPCRGCAFDGGRYASSDLSLNGRVPIMAFRWEVLAMRVLEVMFFTGLLGCVVVVILSWIYIGKDSFTDKS
jgi:hypothetical protein